MAAKNKRRLGSSSKRSAAKLADSSKERRIKAGYRIEKQLGKAVGAPIDAVPLRLRIELWGTDPEIRMDSYIFGLYKREVHPRDVVAMLAEKLFEWIDKRVPAEYLSKHETRSDPFDIPFYEVKDEDVPF